MLCAVLRTNLVVEDLKEKDLAVVIDPRTM